MARTIWQRCGTAGLGARSPAPIPLRRQRGGHAGCGQRAVPVPAPSAEILCRAVILLLLVTAIWGRQVVLHRTAVLSGRSASGRRSLDLYTVPFADGAVVSVRVRGRRRSGRVVVAGTGGSRLGSSFPVLGRLARNRPSRGGVGRLPRGLLVAFPSGLRVCRASWGRERVNRGGEHGRCRAHAGADLLWGGVVVVRLGGAPGRPGPHVDGHSCRGWGGPGGAWDRDRGVHGLGGRMALALRFRRAAGRVGGGPVCPAGDRKSCVGAFGLGLLARPVTAAFSPAWQRWCVAGSGYGLALLVVAVFPQGWRPFFTEVDWVTEITPLTLGGPDVVAVRAATLVTYVAFAAVVAAAVVFQAGRPTRSVSGTR